ncbi:hypothetical protein ACFO1B_14925 [Dactylosporangium siamense]|uniref:hypothetical protein n=1 Tax=Dactylosporangium siamense TaxID=685454 RepID=UPI001943E945|nr:hypothetical protein [Dactylosporangium siamense]
MAVEPEPLPLSWRRTPLTVALHGALLVWMTTPILWVVGLVTFIPEDDTTAQVVFHASTVAFGVTVPVVVHRVARRTERELHWWAMIWLTALIGLAFLCAADVQDTFRGA